MTHEAIHNISLNTSRCELASSFPEMDYNVYVAIKKVCECYFYYQIKIFNTNSNGYVFMHSYFIVSGDSFV